MQFYYHIVDSRQLSYQVHKIQTFHCNILENRMSLDFPYMVFPFWQSVTQRTCKCEWVCMFSVLPSSHTKTCINEHWGGEVLCSFYPRILIHYGLEKYKATKGWSHRRYEGCQKKKSQENVEKLGHSMNIRRKDSSLWKVIYQQMGLIAYKQIKYIVTIWFMSNSRKK